MKKLVIYWARRDLRLNDNPALTEAVKKSRENGVDFCPIFILEDYMLSAETKFQFGFPSRYFLSVAVPEFAKHFKSFLLVKGKGAKTFINLSKHFELNIHVNEDVYVDFYKQIEKLKKNNISVTVHKDMLTVDKNLVSGLRNIYSIFTPFKKACWKKFLQEPVLGKTKTENAHFITKSDLEKIPHQIKIDQESIWKHFSKSRKFEVQDYETKKKHEFDIDDLLPKKEKYDVLYTNEEEALKHFKKYLKEDLENYKEDRDSLEKDKTSKMSLALCWGLVSARTLKQEVVEHFDNDFFNIDWFKIEEKYFGPIHYISELVWREFYKYLLYHHPNLMNEEFQEKFRFKVSWVEEKEAIRRFEAWIKGETGYKVVDAAMMQLAQTGWMHNRSRMVVASVLTKNLGVDWRWGQEYFRAMLLDLDEASNNGGWQWGASVGADPKPIRIFNPYLQAENYDKRGVYQKKWLGEKRYFFETPPIVEHKQARGEALKRYGLDSKHDGEPRDY